MLTVLCFPTSEKGKLYLISFYRLQTKATPICYCLGLCCSPRSNLRCWVSVNPINSEREDTHPREASKLLLIRLAQLRMDRSQCGLLPCKLLVKIASVSSITDHREVWWWDSFMIDIVKVDVAEE